MEKVVRMYMVIPKANTPDANLGWMIDTAYISRIQEMAQNMGERPSMEVVEAVICALIDISKEPTP